MNTGLKHHISTGWSSKNTHHGVQYPGSCVLSISVDYKTYYADTRQTKVMFPSGGCPSCMWSLIRIGNAVYPSMFSGAKSVRNYKLLWGWERRTRQIYKLLSVSKLYQGTHFLGEAFMNVRLGIVTTWRCSQVLNRRPEKYEWDIADPRMTP